MNITTSGFDRVMYLPPNPPEVGLKMLFKILSHHLMIDALKINSSHDITNLLRE